MPSSCRAEATCVTSGSPETINTVGVMLAMGYLLDHRPRWAGAEEPRAAAQSGRLLVAVLDGGVAVRCNPKPALAGLKSRSRSSVHRPTAGSAALKAWSCAATTYEP